jgi:outer membrane protein OmpA-like peptidoglycan-associated protein
MAAGLMGAVSYGVAQTSTPPPAPTPQNTQMTQTPASRIDLFLGYSYFAPHGSVHNSPQPVGAVKYESVDYGAIVSGTYFLNRYMGVTADFADHSLGKNDGFRNVMGGVEFRFPWEDLTPFVHGMAGAAKVGGPNLPGQPPCTTSPCQPGTDLLVEPYKWGVALKTGGGVDYTLPWFDHHLALRVFQADYEYIHANFGPGNTTDNPPGNVLGGRVNIDAVELSSGLVFKFGSIAPPPPVTYSCSVNPSAVFPGDPITITGTATNIDPKKTPAYTWSGNGGKITGTTTTVTIDTAGLNPGSYTVTGHVSVGAKPWQMADCTASYTVKQYEPPTITCSANPSTVAPGGDSAISAQGMSPQNRPLTYSYSASAGTVDPSTSNSTALHTTGAAPGTITVTCNVQDDKGQQASATTTVSVEAPPAPVTPHVQKLCSITFDKDKRRPARVDNEAKACLDEVALSLQQQSGASAVVVGESATGEKMGDKLAKERAVNTKAYLTTEKGIDASRIETRTGPEGSKQVDNYLVPSGATFDNDVQGTTKFDEPMPAAKPARKRSRKPMPPPPAPAGHSTPQ